MGDKGWGLVATEAVEAGVFVMEYVGMTWVAMCCSCCTC